jgi:predicted phage replisome organizer
VADVQWIKLMVGMFDGMSFKRIKKAKIGGESFRDKLTAVWFELMEFAGRCNHDGAFISPKEIPFKDISDIAIMIDREEEELQLCMSFFIKEGMITVVDDIYMLSNWSEYQNTDGMEKIRESNRLRQAKYREKQKLLVGNVIGNVTDNVTVTLSNALDIDIEEEKEEDLDKKNKKNNNKPVRHKFGEYKNVLLSDEDVEKLKNEFPTDYEARIENLSSYIASTGKSYKNHLATIRNWARKETPRETARPKPQSDYDKFMGKLQEMYNEEE